MSVALKDFHQPENTVLHFVGIGGIGMSGIAEVFLCRGYRVTGSDLSESESVRRLRSLGAQIFVGHASGNVGHAHVVVISSAVKSDNPEVVEAKKRRIPVVARAEMLGELMRGKTGFAIAGTHGKTTTTSILSTVLTHAQLDPTLVIGGKVDLLGGNAKLGQGDYVVAEADESDGSFLHLPATFSVITNIDSDHLDHYGSLSAIEDAFVSLVAKLPFYGVAVVCADDAGVRRVLSRFSKPYLTYGFSEEWDYSAQELIEQSTGSSFQVFERKHGKRELLGECLMRVPGKHNVLNALAVIALARKIGLSFELIREGIAAYQGVRRRFEVKWQDHERHLAVVDDYAHHPTEIAATLAAARVWWSGRVIAVFQPHRYSRTLHCLADFPAAFRLADKIHIAEIYAAGEEPVAGITAQTLVDGLNDVRPETACVLSSDDWSALALRLSAEMQPGDLLLCLGAGSITRLADAMKQAAIAAFSHSP